MRNKQDYSNNKLIKKLRREMGKAINDFAMIEPGDRIAVCVSGGKDSYTMLDLLLTLKKHAPVKFEILALNLDQKQPGFPEDVLPTYFESEGVPYKIIEEDTYSLVKNMVPEGKTYCGWCSRFRRGIIYKFARQNGFNKIALGHHRDDIVETLFLNLFYGGKMKAMPPKLLSDDGANVIIRPLSYSREKDISRYAKLKNFPIIPCNLCGAQENLQRQTIKLMLQSWDRQHPGRIESIFRSLGDVIPSHLFDTELYDFSSVSASQPKGLELINLH